MSFGILGLRTFELSLSATEGVIRGEWRGEWRLSFQLMYDEHLYNYLVTSIISCHVLYYLVLSVVGEVIM